MNSVIKEKWVTALRSNEYKQGTQQLCKVVDNEYKFCCLGVLADLYCQEKFDKKMIEVHPEWKGFTGVPHEVMYWSDLDSISPYVTVNNYSKKSLAVLNDGRMSDPWDFKQIADIIEKQL